MIDTVKLNKLLKARQWTDFDLSLAARVPQATVYRMRKGRTVPRVDNLQRICKALDVEISQILLPDLDPIHA